MSRGALGELLRASIPRFIILCADIPTSEKKSIITNLQNRVQIMENLY